LQYECITKKLYKIKIIHMYVHTHVYTHYMHVHIYSKFITLICRLNINLKIYIIIEKKGNSDLIAF